MPPSRTTSLSLPGFPIHGLDIMSTTVAKRKGRHVEKIPLGARVEPAMKAALQKAADRERRSLTAQVEIILAEWLKTQSKRR
jgi:hypothetical protein